jgi:hypothetical protein
MLFVQSLDNLYLDMNGIIHNCSHSDDGSAFPLTENEMMLKVFLYLDKLVGLVRPKKLLYLALDGKLSHIHILTLHTLSRSHSTLSLFTLSITLFFPPSLFTHPLPSPSHRFLQFIPLIPAFPVCFTPFFIPLFIIPPLHTYLPFQQRNQTNKQTNRAST